MPTTTTIGVFSPVTGGFYYGEILAGLTREVAAVGGQVVLLQTLDAGDSRDDIHPSATFDTPTAWEHVDGVVAITAAARRAYLDRLVAAGKALVLVSDAFDDLDVPSVSPDNRGGIRAAVDHLVGHGHSRIAFAGNFIQRDMRIRFEAFRGALAERGLVHDPHLLFEAIDNGEQGGRQVARDAIAAGLPMTALVAATDRNAIGFLEEFTASGLSVPGDVAVIGFDDVERGSFTTPTLSTVSQRFDQVGAMAGRLLLATLRGEEAGVRGAHTLPSVFVPRGSCGCPSTRPIDLPDTSDETSTDLAERLHRLLLEDAADESTRHVVDLAVTMLVAAIDRAQQDAVAVGSEALECIAATLSRFEPPPEAVRQAVALITDTLHRRAAASSRPAVAAALTRTATGLGGTLWQAHAATHLDRARDRERSLLEQYEIGMELLDRRAPDPRGLEWLQATNVRAACLALWDGPPAAGRLRIAGAYDPAGVLPDLVDTETRIEEFPPSGLLALARAPHGEVTFVVPVKARGANWGVLALVGDIDTKIGSGRETYNQWAALLTAAFEQERLLENLRHSDERYSLVAAATRDGLWDWDVKRGEVYYSRRCREMLGDPGPDGLGAPAFWLDAVHPADRTELQVILTEAMAGDPRPIEIEHRVRSEDGTYRWTSCRALPLASESGEPARIVGSLSDIEPRKQLEEQLRQGALYDEVTGLPNRKLFLERLSFAVAHAQRSAGLRYAVVFLDLDGFKLVNDTLGHRAGDQLLREIGSRLERCLRASDTPARFGGDEFAVLLLDIDPAAIEVVVERMQEEASAVIELEHHRVAVSASIGIATSDGAYVNAEDVLRDADIAMYHAKSLGPGSFAFFDADLYTGAVNRLGLQAELRDALRLGQFEMHYQPIVDLDAPGTDHFEALIRWRHPARGLVPPGDFLPMLEETGLIVSLGRWVIAEICRQIAEWRTTFPGPVNVSLNLSHREFWDPGLLSHLQQSLAAHRLTPDCLTVEITEGVIMRKPGAAERILNALHGAGFDIHIDDFGTGHSSLHALHRFAVQALKIDRSFVQNMPTDSRTAELVQVIVAMGAALGLDVVAEGVETLEQLEQLAAMGCRRAQGYWFTRAVDGRSAGELLGHDLHAERLTMDDRPRSNARSIHSARGSDRRSCA